MAIAFKFSTPDTNHGIFNECRIKAHSGGAFNLDQVCCQTQLKDVSIESQDTHLKTRDGIS